MWRYFCIRKTETVSPCIVTFNSPYITGLMKINSKSVRIILLSLLVVSLVYNIKNVFRPVAGSATLQQINEASKKEDAIIISRYKRNKVEHAVVREYKADSGIEKPSLFLDSILNVLAIKEKQLTEATKVNAKLKAEHLKLEQYPDSMYGYHDKWLNLVYDSKNNNVDLSYSLSLNTTKYWKRKWFLAPKQYYIDVFSDDARVNIESMKRFTVAVPKPKKFGIGLSVGYCWTSGKWQPYVGLGLNYNLIRF